MPERISIELLIVMLKAAAEKHGGDLPVSTQDGWITDLRIIPCRDGVEVDGDASELCLSIETEQ